MVHAAQGNVALDRPWHCCRSLYLLHEFFDNIPVSLFLRDASTDMLPIRMWQDLENRMDVSIAAISSVMVFFTVALMVCMEKLTGISRRMR